MPYDLNDPNLDFAGQAEILARALKQSQLLQNTQADDGVKAGGMFYRSSPLSGVGAALSRGVGQYNQSQAEASQTALNQEQLKRYDELTRQMNAPQEGTDYSNPDALMADNTRRMGIATQMSKLPLAQKTAQDYLSKGAAFPEAIAKMRMEQIERGQQNAVRLEEQARREKEKLEAIAREKERDRDNRIFLKSLGGGSGDKSDKRIITTTDENGNPVQQVIDLNQMKPGDRLGKFVPLPKESAAAEKARHSSNLGMSAINDAIAELDKPNAANALGLANALPGMEVVRQYTDPGGIAARASVSNIGSQKVHDRSGATVTIAETPRLAPFIPSVKDSPVAAKIKLGKMREEYDRMLEEWGTPRGGVSKPAAPAAAKVVNFNDL